MIRALRLFAVVVVLLVGVAASGEDESGTLRPTHEPMPPRAKPLYTTDYLFAVTRSITESTMVPAAQVPLVFLAVPIDIAFLPIEAIAGFFPRG